MEDKKIRDALKQAKEAVEQANKALADVMLELDADMLDQVTGAGDPFVDIPRPDAQNLDPNARENG